MRVIAIDPGNEQSAWVVFDDGRIVNFGKEPNDAVRERLLATPTYINGRPSADRHLAIEMIASYGMPVGREVFETCLWIGRFIEAQSRLWDARHTLIYRRDVKLHLCGSARAKDGNIRTALLDRYGGKAKAVGNKQSPGVLYGVSKDVWSALAVAVTYSDTQSANARKSQATHSQAVSP